MAEESQSRDARESVRAKLLKQQALGADAFRLNPVMPGRAFAPVPHLRGSGDRGGCVSIP